jgi:hypothetical protein
MRFLGADGINHSPAVSYQLRIFRDNGFATAAPKAQRRIYALEKGPFESVDEWLGPIFRLWDHKLDALATEISRGKFGRDRESE